MVLDDVFIFLYNTGQAPNRAIFSVDYLGHSPRYYDYLRCSGAKPSLRSLMKVALQLSDMAKGSAEKPDDTIRADKLAKRVMSAALDRCR